MWIVGGTAAILLVLYVFFTRTLFGLAMRGAASDREGAQVIGVDARLISFYAFGISALISATIPSHDNTSTITPVAAE